jgi:hypothetical protein
MPRIRRNPGTSARATSTTRIADTEFTRLLGLQRHEPLTPEDREDLDLLFKAAERGFRLATRCTACGAWISNPISIRRHLGPVCAKKAVAK